MVHQDWTCEVCKQPNCGSDAQCINCACERNALPAEITRRREGYDGPVCDETFIEGTLHRPVPKAFSEEWWNEELDHVGTSIFIAPIGAAAGFLFVVLGALVSGKPLTAEGPLYGALIMGLLLPIRNLFQPFSLGPGFGTRKAIFYSYVIIVAIAMGVVFYAVTQRRL